MYEERELKNKGEKRAPRVKMKRGKERQREERSKVTDRRSSDAGLENKVSIFSCSSFFSLHLPLIHFFPPSSSGLKSDIHHSRVPQTIYLECPRHENR